LVSRKPVNAAVIANRIAEHFTGSSPSVSFRG
jgi:hypothetical protein